MKPANVENLTADGHESAAQWIDPIGATAVSFPIDGPARAGAKSTSKED